jgi:catechol 2,3-dioxygenase-like lactoylglutathione lyase family enzyme
MKPMFTRRALVQASLAAPLLAAGPALAAPAAVSGRSLGAIRMVTITAPDVAAATAGWTGDMGYKLVKRGAVSRAEAASWSAPAMAGKRMSVLGPASGEATYIRFVEQAADPRYEPKGCYGWNTTEITVQNSDKLYEKLKTSTAFKPDGPPHTVPTYEYLRAMQADGPAGERLNLTWIRERRPDLAVATAFVGKVFITVVSVPDLPAAVAFYKDTFGNASSEVHKLPRFDLVATDLDEGCKIEIDQFPAPRKPRLAPPGGLPSGLALVSFDCAGFDRFKDRLKGPATVSTVGAYRGRRTGVVAGAAGELIELIAT